MIKYLTHFFLLAIFLISPPIIFAFWAEPIYGDLTRIGKWTEHDFGPNAIHPIIQVRASGNALKNPDIIVLGDSFSGQNLWQSILTENTGQIVKSFHNSQNCMRNWIRAAINDSANKFVVIETIERDFIAHFKNISSCPYTEPIPLEFQAGTQTTPRSTWWPPAVDIQYLKAAAINTAELAISPEKIFQKEGVVNAPLRTGCALFSNRLNSRFLYYARDDLKQQWTTQEIREAVENIIEIQKNVEQSGKRFVFIIAPDKSSVYQSCLHLINEPINTPNINRILISAGVHTPDMSSIFKENINTVIDLYNPDNTHWSEAGYILAGYEIGRYISVLSSGL